MVITGLSICSAANSCRGYADTGANRGFDTGANRGFDTGANRGFDTMPTNKC